jgi:hypothetical protein
VTGRVSNPSLSFTPPSRPLGLIAFVLFIDLGLAGAGAYLLAKGLAKDDRPAPSEPAGVQNSEAPAESGAEATAAAAAAPSDPAPSPIEPPAAAAAAPASDADDLPAAPTLADATPVDEPKLAANARRAVPDRTSPPATRAAATATAATTAPTTTAATTTPKAVATATPTTTPTTSSVSGAPEDPYGAEQVSPQVEIDRLAARSKGAFDRCRQDAGAIHGGITIAFRVLADGRIGNAVAVENTTGDAQLASCLVATIGTWRVSPHDGAPLSFMRSFQY